MNIPDEAVEAVANELHDREGYSTSLADAPAHRRKYFMTLAREVVEAAAPYMLIHVHHHDIEKHAESYNEGYDAAVTHGLADDPTLADDWFQEKIREAKAEAWDEGVDWAWDGGLDLRDNNPYRKESGDAREA
jgi:hypothetical protein